MDNYHEPLDLLSEDSIDYHRMIRSLIEELEAVDWYNQRAEATENPIVRKVVEHNRDEEIEHAVIVLEWLRRNFPKWDEMMDEFLYTEGDLMHKHVFVKLGMEKWKKELKELEGNENFKPGVKEKHLKRNRNLGRLVGGGSLGITGALAGMDTNISPALTGALGTAAGAGIGDFISKKMTENDHKYKKEYANTNVPDKIKEVHDSDRISKALEGKKYIKKINEQFGG